MKKPPPTEHTVGGGLLFIGMSMLCRVGKHEYDYQDKRYHHGGAEEKVKCAADKSAYELHGETYDSRDHGQKSHCNNYGTHMLHCHFPFLSVIVIYRRGSPSPTKYVEFKIAGDDSPVPFFYPMISPSLPSTSLKYSGSSVTRWTAWPVRG